MSSRLYRLDVWSRRNLAPGWCLTNRWSGRVEDKAPNPISSARGDQLNRYVSIVVPTSNLIGPHS
jgi:hypothetical protein